MKNLDKMKSLLESGEVDALLLTSEVNRHYAARYNIAEGVALICRNNAYYFTDSRYIEAAEKNLPDFTVRMVDREHPYTKLLNEAIEAAKAEQPDDGTDDEEPPQIGAADPV